eukprot:TRINITY_DN47608_c0_g1_i1.p3 TRINITY_DN47608_c0_g1~~TRINITY_DN47608_c0_g1_i1.p3  ORF type:complete len:114 (+),score=2.46 TRINITY_DN47608_c0_g1_i1:365-706(+)
MQDINAHQQVYKLKVRTSARHSFDQYQLLAFFSPPNIINKFQYKICVWPCLEIQFYYFSMASLSHFQVFKFKIEISSNYFQPIPPYRYPQDQCIVNVAYDRISGFHVSITQAC